MRVPILLLLLWKRVEPRFALVRCWIRTEFRQLCQPRQLRLGRFRPHFFRVCQVGPEHLIFHIFKIPELVKANRPDENQKGATPHQQTGRDGYPRQFHTLYTPCLNPTAKVIVAKHMNLPSQTVVCRQSLWQFAALSFERNKLDCLTPK